MKNLRQKGTVRDYVKEFNSLLLDIKNISDEDKLFNFVSGLKPWAQAELRRQNVKDLTTAIAAADGLVDYKVGNSSSYAVKGKGVARKSKGQKDKKFKRKMVTPRVNPRMMDSSRERLRAALFVGVLI